jgi:hypothetical protein
MTAVRDLLDNRSPDEAGLLQCRMTALGLNIGAWTRFQPAMLGELQSACNACEDRVMCARHLLQHIDDPAWPSWRDYCPIAGKLDMMIALQFY